MSGGWIFIVNEPSALVSPRYGRSSTLVHESPERPMFRSSQIFRTPVVGSCPVSVIPWPPTYGPCGLKLRLAVARAAAGAAGESSTRPRAAAPRAPPSVRRVLLPAIVLPRFVVHPSCVDGRSGAGVWADSSVRTAGGPAPGAA